MNGQLDHHCWLTFQGRNWKIEAIAGRYIDLRDRNCTCVLDTEFVDFDTYCTTAAEWNARAWGGPLPCP